VAVLAVTLVLGLESSKAAIWALYLVALVLGTAETMYDTCAQSILPQVVPRDRLPQANGRLIAAELTANEFVGPPLGGLLVAVGVAATFVTPAALWATAVGALLLLRGGFAVPRAEPTTLRADVAEGLRCLWHHRLLRTLAAMTGLFNFATNAIFAVFVLYAVGPNSAMGLTEVAYGVLFATLAAGSLIGALLADPHHSTPGPLAVAVLGHSRRRGHRRNRSRDHQPPGDRRSLPARRPHQRPVECGRCLAATTDHPDRILGRFESCQGHHIRG
jgi:MFS family permease